MGKHMILGSRLAKHEAWGCSSRTWMQREAERYVWDGGGKRRKKNRRRAISRTGVELMCRRVGGCEARVVSESASGLRFVPHPFPAERENRPRPALLSSDCGPMPKQLSIHWIFHSPPCVCVCVVRFLRGQLVGGAEV